MTTIKITELTDIGANLTSTTVLPVVNMTGSPTTQKTILGNIANAILSEAGGDYVQAGVALLAGTVTTAAQPNITSTGTLTSLAVTGNATAGNVLATTLVRGTTVTALDQLNTANLSANGLANIARINVTNTANLGAVGNITITGGSANYVLKTDGAGNLSWVAQSGGGGSANTGNVTFDDVTIQGDTSQLNLSPGPDFTANLAYLQVRGGDVASHIHFDTGNNEAYDLIVGDDQKYVQVSSTGDIIMSSYDGNTSYEMTLDATGNLILPTISLGSGVDEQTVVLSQRKIIPPFRYSVAIDGTTPTTVYTVTDNSITSMKVTIQIQHTGLGMEFFEVYATYTGPDTYYTVNNRLQPPTIDDSTVVVDLNGSNEMEITVTINSGAANCWVTYDATEFGISVD